LFYRGNCVGGIRMLDACSRRLLEFDIERSMFS